MESILAELTGGSVTLAGAALSNSRCRVVIEVLLNELAKCVEKHNCLVERTYRRKQDVTANHRNAEQLDERMGR